MERKTKKEIKDALGKIKESKPGSAAPDYLLPHLEAKKSNKNRIRKQGV
jgi:hypothetical protein